MNKKDCPPEYVLQVKTFIESNYRYSLDTDRIASVIAGVSLRTLQDCFQVVYGITMQQFHLETRMNHAKEFLTETNKSIKEIAALVGYADTSTFDHFFLKMTNTTPEQYRCENT